MQIFERGWTLLQSAFDPFSIGKNIPGLMVSCMASAPTTASVVMPSHWDHVDDDISVTEIRKVITGEQQRFPDTCR